MRLNKVQGQLMLSFTVDKEGNIPEQQTINELSPKAPVEALRILPDSEKQTQGKYKDKNVKTVITIPLDFRFN